MARTLVIGELSGLDSPQGEGAAGELVASPSVADAASSFDPATLDAVLLRSAQTGPQVVAACQQLAASPLKGVPLVVLGSEPLHAARAFAGGAADFWREPADARLLAVALPALRRLRTAPAAPQAAPQPAVVLVADDDAFFRRRVADLVQADGYSTLQAASGHEVLALLDGWPRPALCVMDLFMPGLGGTEVLQHMRDNPRWAGIPVIAVSGVRRDQALAAELARLGVQDFVDKEIVSIESLGALVDEYLSTTRRRMASTRVSTFVLVGYRRTPEDPWLTGFICNLSQKGAFVRTLVPPREGETFHLRMDLGRDRLTLAARVAWTRLPEQRSHEPYGMGIEFLEMGPEAERQVRDWVANACTLPEAVGAAR
ncbi:MAG TPA: response regulator [Myxococcales bacterium]|jgi:CheY-like chemotaxis protein